MKTILTLAAMLIGSAASAQLMNGSFENGGVPDLTGWATFCAATSSTDAAPGSGSYSALVDGGNVKGCFPGWFYQLISPITDGQAFTLSGWCKNSGAFFPDIGFMTAVQHPGGTFSYTLGPTTTNTSWTYLSFADTFDLAAGDVAGVICNAGTLAGPAFSQALFDGVTLEVVIAEGLPDPTAPISLAHFPDPANDELYIATEQLAVDHVTTFDLTGQQVAPRIDRSSAGVLRLDLSALTPGIYFARIEASDREHVVRFVKQ